MDNRYVVCQRKVQRTEDYLRCHLWGTFATLYWRCFGSYLREPKTNRRERKPSGRRAA
jgi:hypothetical protein